MGWRWGEQAGCRNQLSKHKFPQSLCDFGQKGPILVEGPIRSLWLWLLSLWPLRDLCSVSLQAIWDLGRGVTCTSQPRLYEPTSCDSSQHLLSA